MASIDRKIFFDGVRSKPFGGSLSQEQVEGMEAILDAWEMDYSVWDLRWLAYALATTYHETSATMQPIEEYQGAEASYGQPDPETKQCYYGRGYVQLTHRANYARADKELGFDTHGAESCEWHAENALDPEVASEVLFTGMRDGWFRSNSGGQPYTLAMFFNDTRDDPYGARDIINGDKSKVPSWSNGVSIGNLIANYHNSFLAALVASYIEEPYPPEPEPEVQTAVFRVVVTGVGPFQVVIEEANDDPMA